MAGLEEVGRIQPAIGPEPSPGDPLRVHRLDRDRDTGLGGVGLGLVHQPARVVALPGVGRVDHHRGAAERLAHLGATTDLLERIEAPHRLRDDQERGVDRRDREPPLLGQPERDVGLLGAGITGHHQLDLGEARLGE
jgi:hypothetical protein